MIKFYFHPSPNPLKIALYLEETGEPYELIPVDTRKGEQHSDAFKAINPNAKTPAMLDDDVRVFDSNAMLIYLAEKIGKWQSTVDSMLHTIRTKKEEALKTGKK